MNKGVIARLGVGGNSVPRITTIICSIVFSCFLLFCALWATAQEAPHLYVTWSGAEPDKGATAWYIKRYVDKDAVFEVKPNGFLFEEGIAFDTPQARYRRIQNAAAMEMLLRDYPSSDPAINKMASIVHDIEVNMWQAKVYPESAWLDVRMKEIDAANGSTGTSIECYLDFFDNVYQWLKVNSSSPDTLPTPTSCRPASAL